MRKDYFNLRAKSKLLLLTLLALFAGGMSPAWADELTVYDGTNTNAYVPFYGYYGDAAQKSEFIIPSTELSAINGKSITGLTFYTSISSQNWTGTFQVFLKEVQSTTLTEFTGTTDATIVFEGTGLAVDANKKMSVTFADPYTYKGGNLLIGLYQTVKGNYKTMNFYGVNQDNVTAFQGYSSSGINSVTGSEKYFIPKTTFTYESPISGPGLAVYDGSSKLSTGYAYSYMLSTSGTGKTFTIKNPGTESLNINITSTNGFGIDKSSATIDAKGETTLEVTMADATGNGTVTITPTNAEIDPFQINVSGTIKDNNKIFIDFSDSQIPSDWMVEGYSSNYSTYEWSVSKGYISYGGSWTSKGKVTSPKIIIAEGEKIFINYARYGSYTYTQAQLEIEISSDGSTWTTIGSVTTDNIVYDTWKTLECTATSAASYLRINAGYVHLTGIYGGELPNEPKMVVTQPASLNYGVITEATAKTFTIANTGKAALEGISVTSSNNSIFAISNAPTSLAAGASQEVTITMAAATTGSLSSDIAVNATGMDEVKFTVTGAVLKSGTTSVDFNDNKLPANWTNESWTFADGAATGKSYSAYLTSPKLVFASGDFLVLKIKNYDTDDSNYIALQGSDDNGTTWGNGTNSQYYKKIMSSEFLSKTDWTTIVVNDIPTSVNKLRLVGNYCVLDEINGLTYAPALQVKKGDDVQTTGTAHAFGEIGANQAVTYNFTNAGAGTINITNVVSDNAVFTTNWTESTAAPFDLVITANYDAAKAGEQNGKVTVTTSEGTFEINLTSTFLTANAPKFAVLIGETEQTTGADLGFGIITENTTKEFIIKNDGTGALNVTGITLPDEDYTTDLDAAPTSEAPLVVAAGTTKTIKVTLAASAKAIKSSKSIVISATGFEDFTFAADATVMPGAAVVDFAGNKLPDNWTYVGSWTYDTGAAYSKTNNETDLIISPKLKFNDNDFIVLKAKGGDTSTSNFVSVRTSTDNGSTWTTLKKINQSNTTFTNSDFSTIVVDGISSSVNKIAIASYWAYVDDIAGLTIDANDPKLGIYSDAECTAAVATSVSKDFGFVTADATATYYIKNDGTGTMTISKGDDPAGFSAILDKTSLASGEKATLTITMAAADNTGYHSGNVVVTATDLGTFTVATTGVVVDENKLNLDFTTATIPTTWTANNWSKNASGYIETSGYSSTALETSTLTAAAGEDLVIVAKQTYGSSSYQFGVKYKKADAEEWSDLIAASNIGTSWTTLHATIEEAGDYLLQINGYYAQIQHIYGLTEPSEPVMVVYDGESVAAATYSFGSVANDADAVKTFTVKNEGKAVLAGLTATLTGDNADHYNVAITGLTDGGVAAGASATITVKQLKDNLGAHAAMLTISSTSEGIDNKVITLSGTTRDASKLFVDFAGGIPANWPATNWSATSGYAQTAYSGTCTLQTPALTIAAGEELSFDLSKQYNNNSAQLAVRYTTDGGVTWTEQDLTSDLTYGSFATKTFSLGNESSVTAILQFVGTYYARLDNFYGGTATTAPMISLTESSAAVVNGSTKEFGTLTAQATATYTLKNNGTAAMVSTVATTGVATAAITGEGEGITIDDNTVTLAAGKSATITLTLPYAAPYGEKTGAMTITTEGWVGDFTVNYTATTIDPTALNIDFASNAKPEGFYSNGWTYTSGYAANTSMNNVAEFITSKLTVAGTDDVLSFDARACYNDYGESLTVSYSTDRKDWTEATVLSQSDLTASYQTFQVSGLAAGNYYLKFAGKYVYVDNILGWHYATPVPEHDLYVASATLPTEAVVPGSEYTATVNVASLAAAETVKAELYFNINKVGELTEDAIIAKDETKTITITGNVPNEEGKDIAVYVKIYNDDVIVQTEPVAIDIAHTRTLKITEFKLAEGQEETAEADAANQFTAEFDVTVENTGTVELVPRVYIFNGETPVGYAIATDAVAVGNSTTLTITAQNMSAGEGGDLQFTAKAYWKDGDEPEFAYANPVTITVTAAAPKFDLAVKGGAAVTDGDDVAFGLVKEATTKTYTITNSGNKALELVSIVAPEGYEVTAVTDANKTIAIDGTLDIDVTLKAEQGKKSGDLVFTYKVDATTNNTFTLALTGRSVSEDTWTEAFDTEIPSAWTNNGWEWNPDRKAAYSTYSKGKQLMTPRLAAEKDEELTFDVIFPYSKEQLKVQYSTDKTTWNDVETYSSTANEQTFEGSFVAPAAGNYYLRFGDANSRYAYIDNLVGFKLNVPEHDTEIAAESVPTTGTQYAVYTATVTLKENAGKAEEVTAKLIVAGEEKATKAETITANGTTTITLTWTPDAVIVEAVKAKITVTGTGIDLATEEVDLTVAAPYTLDETKSDEVVNDTYPALILKHTFVEGWNTVCLPFNIAVSKLHAEAVAFEFTSYDSTTKELTFTKRTDLVAGTPYVVYVPAAVTTDYVLNNVEITSLNTTAASSTSTPVSFKGTYAPMAAGSLADCFGLTAAGKIVKANASTTMKGFRGYFTGVPVGASARFIGFIDDELTGIRMITVDQNVEGVFNLQGQKIQQMKKGGLYIINGKKQVVK